MLSFGIFRWLLLHFIFGQLNIYYIEAAWPLSTSSNVQLLGLFQDAENASETTTLSVHSRAMFKAAVLLSQQYNITLQGQYIGWQVAQTGGNVIDAASDTCQAVSTSNTIGIVGPALSREALIIAEFVETIGIPAISYSATDPDLSDRNAYSAFYRTVPSDTVAATAIYQLFLRYNWTSCIIIYQNDDYGSGGAKAISNIFLKNGLTVEDMIAYDITSLSILGNLTNSLINSASRIVVLWAEITYTSLILQNALDGNVLGPLFTWILSSSVSLDSFNQTFNDQLIGMLTVEPSTASSVGAPYNITLLNAAYSIWQQYEPETFPGPANVNDYALFSFDATWTLIKALQQLCSLTINSTTSCTSFNSSTFCFYNRYMYSNLLLDIISSTSFLGVSGLVQFSSNITDRINGSYYVAQNVQTSSNGSSFVPVLDYADPNGWKSHSDANTIVWPGSSSTPSLDRAVLNGVTLRIGVIQSDPFLIVTNVATSSGQTQQLSGYVPDLIDLLKTNMGFIPITILAPSSQTYDQIIQGVPDGIYDIIIGDVTVTSTRRETVAFSNAIFDNSLRLLMRTTPDASVDLLSFLKPFSRNLWLLILGTWIYAGLLFCLIERRNNEALEERSIISQIVMSVWYGFGNIVGYGVEFKPNTAGGRLLTAGLYILSLILVASYTANLASNLTIQKSTGIISGVDDLKSGKIPYNRIGVRVGTASEDYYLNEISGGIKNYYPLTSKQDTYDSLLADAIDVSFIDSGVGEYITNNVYCNLTLVGEGFDVGVFGIVTPKDWLYSKDLDVNVLQLRESGDIDNLYQKWFMKQICPEIPEASTAFGVQSLGGLFITFAVISILSLLLKAWTKRHEIKGFCLTSICRKKLPIKTEDIATQHSIETSERAEKYILSSSDL